MTDPRTATFEANARQTYSGRVVARCLGDLKHCLSEYDYQDAARNESEWVRVRITVELIEEP